MTLDKGTETYDFISFVEEVYLFNNIADTAREITTVSFQDIKNQYKVVDEEVKEIGEAITENNPVKVLDGVVDSLVTLLGLAKQLEELGFDVLGACQQVAYDNLQKFPSAEEEAVVSVDSFKAKGVDVTYNEVITNKGNVFVLLDNNNKVRKSINFKSTDLSSYVPKDFTRF